MGIPDLERKRTAGDLLSDLLRVDRELIAIKTQIGNAVALSQTSLLELRGVDTFVAGLIRVYVRER